MMNHVFPHDRLPVPGFLRSVNLRRVNWMRVRSRSRREMIKRTTKSDQINKSTPNPKRKTLYYGEGEKRTDKTETFSICWKVRN
uniref:Uncharacterized protein n=1 Tax=Picea glauca TaxID=3330 RepID=A0A101LWM9_PICGL|nr:hypothetical protein ABT39_MTgene1376 [Picea glauca]QHR89470.1 hypothetical protein Q903MT_gene3491 [Picea sitchensis]